MTAKKSPCWLKYLPTIWKGTAIACQYWVCVCVCCATDTDIRSLPGGDSLQKLPKFGGIVLRWKKSEWAQHWCRNVTAARLCTRSLTPTLLLPPGWPFLMTLTPVGLCSKQHPFYLFLSTYILLYISKTTVSGWMHPGGRKHCPILQEQFKGDQRLHDRVGRREPPQSSAEPETLRAWTPRQKEKCPRKQPGLLWIYCAPEGLRTDSSQTDNRLCSCPPHLKCSRL